MTGPIAALAFALLAVSAGLSAPASRQPVPCLPCFVCVQGGADVGLVPQPECPLPRS